MKLPIDIFKEIFLLFRISEPEVHALYLFLQRFYLNAICMWPGHGLTNFLAEKPLAVPHDIIFQFVFSMNMLKM